MCGKYYENEGGKCINITQDRPGCYRLPLNLSEATLLENDTLLVIENQRLYQPEDWEYRYENDNHTTLAGYLVCSENPGGGDSLKFSDAQSYLSAVCSAISLTCLAIHIVVYSMLKRLRNVPGKNLLSLAVSLFIAQLLFLLGVNSTRVGVICVATSLAIHYFFLAAFFWMNVMAFDVYRTFTSHRHSIRKNRTFLYYSLYGWLTPFVIVVSALIVNYTTFLEEYAPQYGRRWCWINNKKGLSLFFALPVGSLLLENMFLFGMSVYGIYSQARASKFAVSESSKNLTTRKGFIVTKPSTKSNAASLHQNKVRLVLYMKLAAIMGLGWIFGFVAGLADIYELWYIYIVLNGLQGAFIFLAFDLKKKVFYTLWEQVTGRPFTSKQDVSQNSTTNTGTLLSAVRSTKEKRYKVNSGKSEKAKSASDGKPTAMIKTRNGGTVASRSNASTLACPTPKNPKSLILSPQNLLDSTEKSDTKPSAPGMTEQELLKLLLQSKKTPASRRSLGAIPAATSSGDSPEHIYASLKTLPSKTIPTQSSTPVYTKATSVPTTSSELNSMSAVLQRDAAAAGISLDALNPAFLSRLDKACQLYASVKETDGTPRSRKKSVDAKTKKARPPSGSCTTINESEAAEQKKVSKKSEQGITGELATKKVAIDSGKIQSVQNKRGNLPRSATTGHLSTPAPDASSKVVSQGTKKFDPSSNLTEEALKRLLIKKQFQDCLTGNKEGRGPANHSSLSSLLVAPVEGKKKVTIPKRGRTKSAGGDE